MGLAPKENKSNDGKNAAPKPGGKNASNDGKNKADVKGEKANNFAAAKNDAMFGGKKNPAG